jgi:hypothetical protein
MKAKQKLVNVKQTCDVQQKSETGSVVNVVLIP